MVEIALQHPGMAKRVYSRYQDFSSASAMRLRSGHIKPYKVQSVKRKSLLRKKTSEKSVLSCECLTPKWLDLHPSDIQNSTAVFSGDREQLPSWKLLATKPGFFAFILRETVKCYILTEDLKTVHFDIDENGHHEISTKDSQSCEDIAWLSVFTRNEPGVTESKNFVILTQRSKHNEFVLLSKGKKHLSLKVLKSSSSEPDYHSKERSNMKTCSPEDPDFKQVSEDNHLFIMHYEGESVQFQCYEDKSYYLYVNDDLLDIRKLENKDPDEVKNFYFRVLYI